jgi:ATP-binding cassette subfamily B protein RaxB
MAWIQHCAELACIASEIESLPMQYNTLVGDLGSSLSGGQKQRILLARALYRGPVILFMDEATSHVDAGMEAKIISRMRDERYTRVSIAHRHETISAADRVFELQHAHWSTRQS